MKLLYIGGVKNSLDDLEDAAFTFDNLTGGNATQAAANTTIDATTSKGLLAGSVVALKGSRLIGRCIGDVGASEEFALGLLLNDVAGNANENTPAVASGKGPYLHGSGEVELDVYETATALGAAITYAFGDLLYCSENGLLTNEDLGSQRALGIVKKVPTAADPFLGLQLLI